MSATVEVIEILGPGCPRCVETRHVVQHVVDEAKLACRVEKSTSARRMTELGVLASPAIAFDGRIVFAGRIPTADDVRRLLELP